MNSEPYELMDGFPGWIKVCAWCYPGNTIYDVFPDLRGMQISHSICPQHKEKCLGGLLKRVKALAAEKPGPTEPIYFETLKG
jgi:hypothetical protein